MKSSKRRIKANRRLQNAILHRLKQQRLQLLMFGNSFTSYKNKLGSEWLESLREKMHDPIAFQKEVENGPIYGGEIYEPKAIEDRILKVKREMGVKFKDKGDQVVYINPTA